MPETEEITISILRAKEPITVKTHRRIVITIKSAPCRLIEMEDVLFHLDSAVIMPENPEGKSSSQGSSDERQLRVSGVRALSLVFRQLQLHPEQKLLICGHADRSGKTAYNFELSALRAQGVYLLLCGKRSEWAKLAESKHRIEDYQQIMKYYALVNGWICDPGAIDNTWGPKTERAIKEFIFSWNTSFNHKAPGAQKLDMAIVNQIRNSSSHAWPQALWEAVYDLYEHDLITAAFGANVPKDKIESLRSQIVKSFVDPQRPWVACGESFPKDAHPGVNYRSQTDRRVEILFFDADELPILNCPEQTASVHTAKECPLRRGNCFTFEYIDPSTYFTAEYHLKFEYYDRIKKQRLPVQVAFPIAAWKEGSIALQSKVVLGKDGILTVTVSGITHSPREDDIYFTFETPEQYYLFTESSTSDPVLITESQLVSQLQAERDALPPDKQASAPLTFAQLPFERRRHYYDLPKKWDSRNWFCRKGIAEGVWKEVAVQETTASEPICFSFDDVVLFTEHNGVLQPVQWKESYRFSAFSSTMEVNYPDPDRPWFTLGTSPRNLLSYFITGEDLRAIALCGRFYDITTRRTVKGDIVGVRAAILDDQTVHVSERRREPVAEDCGHYDLHYFSECTDKDGKACSVLLVHWIAHLEKGTGNVTEWDLDKFRHKGFSGCKERWEKKGY